MVVVVEADLQPEQNRHVTCVMGEDEVLARALDEEKHRPKIVPVQGADDVGRALRMWTRTEM